MKRILTIVITLICSCQSPKDELIDSWAMEPFVDYTLEEPLIDQERMFIVEFKDDNTYLTSDGESGNWTKKNNFYVIQLNEDPTENLIGYIENDKLKLNDRKNAFVRLIKAQNIVKKIKNSEKYKRHVEQTGQP